MSSGTVAVSAKKNGRKFLGFEISPTYHKVIQERLKKVNIEITNFIKDK